MVIISGSEPLELITPQQKENNNGGTWLAPGDQTDRQTDSQSLLLWDCRLTAGCM